MKNKIIVICTVITILCFSFLLYFSENDLYKNRYHEHLEKSTSNLEYNYLGINETTYKSKDINIDKFSSGIYGCL